MLQSDMPKKADRKSSAGETQSTDKNSSTEELAPGQVYILKALVLENGSCPIEDWIRSIKDTQTKQRVQSRLDRIERGNMGDCKPVGDGIFEFRMDFGPGYRLYHAAAGTTIIVLLLGGDKSTQGQDILLAQKLWKEYKDDTERYKRAIRR